MATLAIMISGAILNAAIFIGGNYLAKALSGDSAQAALDEKKNVMTEPLKNIKRIMLNTKRIAHNSLTGLQNKIVTKIKLYTLQRLLQNQKSQLCTICLMAPSGASFVRS